MDDRRLLDRPHQSQDELRASTTRIAEEFFEGFEAVEKIDRPAVSIFGSARVREGSLPYESARATAKRFGEEGWAVITGGGPGVMEAANRGCKEGGGLSVGFNIELPHEQHENPYLDISHTFRHFYARKTMFVKPAQGFVVFPGGFGTADELFESLTLIQTGKTQSPACSSATSAAARTIRIARSKPTRSRRTHRGACSAGRGSRAACRGRRRRRGRRSSRSRRRGTS
jgi:uncharacterized protein (TIGR00730 family)